MTLPANQDNEPGQTREAYVFLREEIRHQHNLINQRLSWLVSSQAFLLTAFAIALNSPVQSKLPAYEKLNMALVNLLPVAGVLTCFLGWLTIWAAILQLRKVRETLGNTNPPHFPSVQSSIAVQRMGLSGPFFIPMLFLAVWMVLLLQG
ncbi:MAG: hypothetical protein JWR26_337 [Pedosphaera sp.]|nr:hypothetical protein [Pedosphaera sp.]